MFFLYNYCQGKDLGWVDWVAELNRSPNLLLSNQSTTKSICGCVQAVLDLNPDHYDLYEGADTEDVLDEFEAHRSSWSFLSLVNMRRKDISLNPFNTTCVGIRTNKDYTIRLQVTRKSR